MSNPPSNRPRLATYTLDLNVICDICGKPRTVGRHTKCSRTRQQRMNAHWESVMANQAAKKLQQANGLRPLR
ncbi:hypothetical protein NTD82_14000 [Pseudomonas sp. 5P_5.1_Bac1]|nr:hypothetical protein [Pseudomonas sp. 5P_5.1_Bac1]